MAPPLRQCRPFRLLQGGRASGRAKLRLISLCSSQIPGTPSRDLWGLRVTYALSPVCSDMDGLQGRCSLVAACQGRIRRKLSRGTSLKARRALHLPQVPSWDSWEKKKHAWSWAKPWASTQGHVFTSSAFLSAHGQEVLVNISTACS